MQSSSKAVLQPTIIGVADARHYLVGIIDSSDNFTGLGQRSVEVVSSLVAAKAYLRRHNVFSALLELQSAYDEMCSLPTRGRYRERISF